MTSPESTHCPHCFAAPAETPCPVCGWQPHLNNPPPALALGTLLDGRYRIGRVLGHGGFGITYLAWDDNLHLRLAIKEYFPRDSAGRGADGVSLAIYSGPAREQFAYGLDRFLEEARTLAHFDQHPGIVTVKNFFRAHGTGYCVMDYVEGITLRQYLDQQPGGRISVADALQLLTPVMDALRAVHKDGLLHRDLAPDNIYLSQDGRIKLLDFGAARFAASEHSKSLSIILKPGYAPEEQYRTRGNQGPWTDVYGLAATLYRAITGQIPPEALDRLDNDDLVPPSRLGVAITPGQEAALLRALAVKAGQRFQGMAEMQQAWRDGGGVAPPPGSESGGPVPPAAAVTANAKPVTRPSAQDGTKPVDADKSKPPAKRSRTGYVGTTYRNFPENMSIPPAKAANTGRKIAEIGGLIFLSIVGYIAIGQHAESLRPSQTTGTPASSPGLVATGGGTVAEGQWAFDQGDYHRASAILRPLADAGDPVAQFYLGWMYTEGRGIENDGVQGVNWYRKSAEQGVAGAQFNLGIGYATGQGVAQDAAQAVRWYRKAAEQGLAAAQVNLGGMYYTGQGVVQDQAEAARWYRKAAEQGNASAQFILGVVYDNGQGVAKDEAEAVGWYRKAAEQGDASAQNNLGWMYSHGQGIAKDAAEAVGWYRKAAEQGDAAAQFNLGLKYARGKGVAKNEAEAVVWYRKAAEQGHAKAQFNLGAAYHDGLGVAKNEAEAVQWYRKAAEQGLPQAQNSLGGMYDTGQGVAQDAAEAVRWYRMAADQGDAVGQFNLGVAYHDGLGVTQDKAEATRWYSKAADQGVADAQNHLGEMYATGQGVAKDKAEAARWYRKAAEQGNTKAQAALKALGTNPK